MSTEEEIIGPYILWVDYGYEGWKPRSFNSINEALKADKFNEWIITKRVDFEAKEVEIK